MLALTPTTRKAIDRFLEGGDCPSDGVMVWNVIAEDLVRDIKTFFFHCYLFFFLSYNFFGVLYSSIIFHLFIPSVDIVCTMYNGFISENKKKFRS